MRMTEQLTHTTADIHMRIGSTSHNGCRDSCDSITETHFIKKMSNVLKITSLFTCLSLLCSALFVCIQSLLFGQLIVYNLVKLHQFQIRCPYDFLFFILNKIGY